MNPTNLLQKLAPVGVAAFGAIAFTGIATAPAQAAVIGEFQFVNGTDNFFEEVVPGIGDTFNVEFSDGGLASSFDTFGIFVPPLEFADSGNPQLLSVVGDPIVGSFLFDRFVNGVDATDGFVYNLTSDLVFTFTDQDNGNPGTVSVRYGAGEEFLGIFDGGGVEFEEETTVNASVEIDDDGDGIIDRFFPNGDTSVTEILTFGDLAGGVAGEYGGEVQVSHTTPVPEPTTILGLLTISALGLGLKRKKHA
ncbi:MAG: PEP-CTERM sorting domain-containing protein [Xenococcus sp. (in: cyanobacteria)]